MNMKQGKVPFFLNSKTEIIIDDSKIGTVFESKYSTTMTEIQKYQADDSGWTIDKTKQ